MASFENAFFPCLAGYDYSGYPATNNHFVSAFPLRSNCRNTEPGVERSVIAWSHYVPVPGKNDPGHGDFFLITGKGTWDEVGIWVKNSLPSLIASNFSNYQTAISTAMMLDGGDSVNLVYNQKNTDPMKSTCVENPKTARPLANIIGVSCDYGFNVPGGG